MRTGFWAGLIAGSCIAAALTVYAWPSRKPRGAVVWRRQGRRLQSNMQQGWRRSRAMANDLARVIRR